MSAAEPAERIRGYDLARSLAILGMIVVHFSLAMAADETQPQVLAKILEWLDGRAAATFMVLAGVGIALQTRKAHESGEPARLVDLKRRLWNRGWALFGLGCLNLAIWPGDILRVYGLTFLMVTRFLQVSTRTLLLMAAAFFVGFLLLFAVIEFDANWEWESMTYHGLWTPSGWLRNLIYDGFRSVFPWSGMIFVGMALGRVNLRDPTINRCLLVLSGSAVLVTEIVSAMLVRWAEVAGWDHDVAVAIFGTVSMPALPLFLTTAIGTAIFLIAACVRWGGDRRWATITEPLANTGKLALTWYLGHIVIGLGTVVVLEEDGRHGLGTAMLTGFAFYAGTVVVSTLWLRWFRQGPLEALLRRVCG